MNNSQPIVCPEHGNEVYPFWSKKNKDWYAICNQEFSSQYKSHFVKINDDAEFDRGFNNQYDPDYQVEFQHETA